MKGRSSVLCPFPEGCERSDQGRVAPRMGIQGVSYYVVADLFVTERGGLSSIKGAFHRLFLGGALLQTGCSVDLPDLKNMRTRTYDTK